MRVESQSIHARQGVGIAIWMSTVQRIHSKRVTDGPGVDADLMSSTRRGTCAYEGEAIESFDGLKDGDRGAIVRPGFAKRPHLPFPPGADGAVDRAPRRLQRACKNCRVLLGHSARLEIHSDLSFDFRSLGEYHQTARQTIDPVHDTVAAVVSRRLSSSFVELTLDEEGQTARGCSVTRGNDRQTTRLVEHDEAIVFVQDLQSRHVPRFRQRDGRNVVE